MFPTVATHSGHKHDTTGAHRSLHGAFRKRGCVFGASGSHAPHACLVCCIVRGSTNENGLQAMSVADVRDVVAKPSELIIFGYGSLIWKTGFPYVERIVGYVEHYQRLFYQVGLVHVSADVFLPTLRLDLISHLLSGKHRPSRCPWKPWSCCDTPPPRRRAHLWRRLSHRPARQELT